MARVTLTDDAKEDLRDLDGNARVLVAKALKKLEIEPEKRGSPLGSNASCNLTGFRKLIVDNRDYRIVFRIENDGHVCVVWVVGPRADGEVYELAVSRLRAHSDSSVTGPLRTLLDTVFDEFRPEPDRN